MEAINYAQSPFADYLKETGRIEEELMNDDEVYHDLDSESGDMEEQGKEEHENHQSTTASQVQPSPALIPFLSSNSIPETPTNPTPPSILLASPSAENNPQDLFPDRLGYALVTSSLLTPSLNVELYPTPGTKPSLLADPSPKSALPIINKPLDWGEGWETRGQILSIDALWKLAILVVVYIHAQILQATAKPILTAPGTPIDKSKPFSTHDLVLETVDSLVSISQEVDLKIARALVGVREVEQVGVEPGSSELPLSQSQSRRRPLSLSIAPPFLRALPLREQLLTTITSINSQITTSLSTIRPIPASFLQPLVTPRTSPDTITARLSSPIHFGPSVTTSSSISPSSLAELDTPSASASTSTTTSDSKRNNWDEAQSFGGVDRSALSSPTRRPASPRTIWEDPSPSSITVGALNQVIPGVPQKRRRPSSLHIWSVPAGGASASGTPSSTGGGGAGGGGPMNSIANPAGGTLGRSSSLKRYSGSKQSGEENLTTLFRSSSARERTSISYSASRPKPLRRPSDFDANTFQTSSTTVDTSPTSIDSLQMAFDSLHSNRLQLLWRLITLTDRAHSVPDQEWLQIRLVLERLVSLLQEASRSITDAVEQQFGKDSIGSETFLINNGRSSRLSMLFDTDQQTSSTSTSSRHPPSRPLSLAFSNTSSIPSSPTPIQSFAPRNPNSTSGPLGALNTFEQQTLKMSLTLRLLATKLTVVNDEISRRRSLGAAKQPSGLDLMPDTDGEEHEEELLVLHDSLRGELIKLGREWEESRISLREFVGKKPISSVNAKLEIEAGSGRLFNKLDFEVAEKDSAEERILYSEGPLGEPFSSPTTELNTRQALQDATNSSYLPPSHGPEQIYESLPPPTGSLSSEFSLRTTLSRDERIKNVKAERRKGSVLLSRTGSSGSIAGVAGIGMVEELKDVLELLKGRNKIAVE